MFKLIMMRDELIAFLIDEGVSTVCAWLAVYALSYSELLYYHNEMVYFKHVNS